MKKFDIYVFFIFLQASVFVFGHSSKLINIYDTNTGSYVNLGALTGDSNPQDELGVCYGSYGAAAQQQVGPFQVLPRCHSEVYLLKRIIQARPNLNNLRISIQNENFLPCKLSRGDINPYSGQEERNPGIPCHTYFTNFARNNGCQILVQSPKGKVTYP